MNQLAKEIAKREGLKVQLPIGQIREVLRVLVDLLVDEDEDLGADVANCLNAQVDARYRRLMRK